MARQTGIIKITGTVGHICFYQLNGEYYVRTKSSLTRQRFFSDHAFERSRRSAERFALANRLASVAYTSLAKEKRIYSLYRLLQKKAVELLKEGLNRKDVAKLLKKAGLGLVKR